MKRVLVIITCGLMLWQARSAAGQVHSQIGTHLESMVNPSSPPNPVTGHTTAFFKCMTADGESVVFVSGWSDLCKYSAPELAVMRADGTGFRVVVPYPVLKTQEPNPTSSWHMRTMITQLRLSGDGRWLTFMWPHNQSFDFCDEIGPWYNYIVNVETGEVNEFTFNGKVVGNLSYSDDGMLAFAGWVPETNSYWYHLADPDGSNAVPFLDAAVWSAGGGLISGDGSKFAFTAGPAFSKHAWVMDLETMQAVKLTPAPMDIYIVHPSADASRVVIGSAQDAWAVNGDGTDFRLFYPVGGGPPLTITRDGRHVFHYTSAPNPDGWSFARSPWEGGPPVVVDGHNPYGLFPSPQPVSGDGSRMAAHGATGGNFLLVWHAEPPVLATYGYGTPGTPFTFEVGGEPGQLFAVQAQVQRGSGLAGLPGILPRWAKGALITGSIAGPDNVGSHTTTVPSFVPPGGELEVQFRGWVFDPGSRKVQPTNTTTMVFTNPTALPVGASSGVTTNALAEMAASTPLPSSPLDAAWSPFTAPSLEERIWGSIASNPQIWLQLQESHYMGFTLESLATRLGFTADEIAQMRASWN